MNSKRLYFGLVGGCALLLVATIATAYGLSGALKHQAGRLADAKAQAQALASQQTGLAGAKHDIAKYSSLEQITRAIVPQDKDQAETVRQITKIAAASGVNLTTIAFPASNLGSSTAAPVTSSAANSLSQLVPVIGIPGVYDQEITIGNNANNPVNYGQLDNFLQGLEHNRRTAQVSSITITPSATNPSQLTFTLIVNNYIKPS